MKVAGYYTGVGSRTTPPEILTLMGYLAKQLAARKYIVRTGGADGADTAFAEAVPNTRVHLFLPYKGFNKLYRAHLAHPSLEAYTMASQAHPVWGRLTPGAKALHARNCHQVLGRSLESPSDFLVCWTPDGCETEDERSTTTGGTGTAIVIANRHGIPVFNLAKAGAHDRLQQHLANLEEL